MEENHDQPGLTVKAIVESLLLVADGPAPVNRLAAAGEYPVEDIEAALRELQDDYRDRGIRIQRSKGAVQLVTAPEAATYVQRFLGQELTVKLSPAALEALSIVAYRQPITRPQIEAVRGVNCDGVIRTLLAHEMIEEVGRLEQAGRPILYGTTFQFLQQFGLHSVDELPPLSGETVGGAQ